jgi:hypothetical protein
MIGTGELALGQLRPFDDLDVHAFQTLMQPGAPLSTNVDRCLKWIALSHSWGKVGRALT